MFKYELRQKVWYLDEYFKPRVGVIASRKYVETMNNDNLHDDFVNGVFYYLYGNKPISEEFLFESKEELIAYISE